MERSVRIVAALVLVLSTFVFGAAVSSAAPLRDSTAQNYIVLYKSNAVPADAASTIAAAGGTLVYKYDKIGVAIATSGNASFSANLQAAKGIEGVSATAAFGTQLLDAVDTDAEETTDGAVANVVIPPGWTYQWDMTMINLPAAHAITTGSADVVVGDIDTGLDYTHPALAPNVDFSRSVSCIGGVPNQDPAAWMDDNGHGTHTAGTIAAQPYVSGTGGINSVVGVAPNVKLAGIKAGNAAGYFFPEAVICSFMWAADHGIQVTNNSYFADPWLFNCRNDAEQRAIWKAEQRAIRYAMSKGVVVVAAMGNESMDLSKKNIDDISPDTGTPLTREVTNACVVIPAEISGVIGVSAVTRTGAKAGYSNFGVGVTNVSAPGSQVRSTRRGGGTQSLSGTSMASPHVAGLAALVVSQYQGIPQGAVQALIQNTADPQPCPAGSTTCQGDLDYNGFFGHGRINALNAVTAR